MKIVDANVLLYAVNEGSAHHAAARAWLDETLRGSEPVGFPWVVVLAFLRLATHPGVFPRPLGTGEAVEVVTGWMAQPPAVVVEPGIGHIEIMGRMLAIAGAAGNLVNDAHVAALAVENGAEVVLYDSDFSRFPGVKRLQPPER